MTLKEALAILLEAIDETNPDVIAARYDEVYDALIIACDDLDAVIEAIEQNLERMHNKIAGLNKFHKEMGWDAS